MTGQLISTPDWKILFWLRCEAIKSLFNLVDSCSFIISSTSCGKKVLRIVHSSHCSWAYQFLHPLKARTSWLTRDIVSWVSSYKIITPYTSFLSGSRSPHQALFSRSEPCLMPCQVGELVLGNIQYQWCLHLGKTWPLAAEHRGSLA